MVPAMLVARDIMACGDPCELAFSKYLFLHEVDTQTTWRYDIPIPFSGEPELLYSNERKLDPKQQGCPLNLTDHLANIATNTAQSERTPSLLFDVAPRYIELSSSETEECTMQVRDREVLQYLRPIIGPADFCYCTTAFVTRFGNFFSWKSSSLYLKFEPDRDQAFECGRSRTVDDQKVLLCTRVAFPYSTRLQLSWRNFN